MTGNFFVKALKYILFVVNAHRADPIAGNGLVYESYPEGYCLYMLLCFRYNFSSLFKDSKSTSISCSQLNIDLLTDKLKKYISRQSFFNAS